MYTFSVLIPWEAFPPLRELAVRDLRLKVDVFAKAPAGRKMGSYATAAPAGEWGDPATFNQVRLASPHEFVLTPCHVRLEQADKDGRGASWFRPPAKVSDGVGELPTRQPLREDFTIENLVQGYRYELVGNSPEIDPVRRFWREIGPGETICGPKLALRRGGKTFAFEEQMHTEGFAAHRLADGWLLVRSGPAVEPRSPLGTGQCGACPEAVVDVYAISPEGKLTPALDINQDASGEGGEPDQADLHFADDWSKVTLFKEETDGAGTATGWSSEDYCLVGHEYKSCGKHEKVPTPPVYVRDLRQPE